MALVTALMCEATHAGSGISAIIVACDVEPASTRLAPVGSRSASLPTSAVGSHGSILPRTGGSGISQVGEGVNKCLTLHPAGGIMHLATLTRLVHGAMLLPILVRGRL